MVAEKLSCGVGHVGHVNGDRADEPTIGDIGVFINAKFNAVTSDGIIGCTPEGDVDLSGQPVRIATT
jgi:hypothetical protein